ncbi:unnamed protein product [Callosobruchus maculatus]|uniref:Uncharacterized protein n=1 Tax=Callosobruchus maculatus TaxID=64391 RepID=A0A653DJI3_CALMS|nr:unnamed protein product [Callosobruchus maculatus]
MGCSNCGQSFCGKCLREKCKIPSKDDKNHSVCRTCYIKLTSPADSTNAADQHVMAPDVFFKRMENLDKPKSQSPITVYGQDLINREQFLCAGLSQADIQLEKRLQKLKDHGGEIKTLPTDSEIRARLSKLKGENSYTKEPTKGKLLYPADSRSDSKRVDSLLEQYVTEKDIELSKNDGAVEEIEARLATLREQGVRPNEGPYVRQLHDDLPEEGTDSEEQEVDKLTRRIMDEVAMDARNPLERRAKSKEEADEDSTDERDEWEDEVEEKVRKDSPELPWCVLCNNDATYRCLDCAGDLYCDECNREVHQNWGENGHKVVRYRRT